MTTQLAIQTTDRGVLFQAKVVPGSSRTAACGLLDRMLKIKVAAPPEKGKANACIVEYLAKVLGLKKNDIEILSGLTGPVKQIHISGIDGQTLCKALDLPLTGPQP